MSTEGDVDKRNVGGDMEPGAVVRIVGLVKAAQHNGKLGRLSARKGDDGRVGVQLRDGQVLSVRPDNLEVVTAPAASTLPEQRMAAGAPRYKPPAEFSPPSSTAPPLKPPPPRSGEGSWDDIDTQQVMLTLTDDEHRRAKDGSGRPTLLAALSEGLRTCTLRCYVNAPRYDRLVVWTRKPAGGGLPGSASYTVEMDLDAWEGNGGWTTRDFDDAALASQGLVEIGASTLQAECGGVLAFLEVCKRLGPPRYLLRTALDLDAKPHVLQVVERLLASCALRCLLHEEALARLG